MLQNYTHNLLRCSYQCQRALATSVLQGAKLLQLFSSLFFLQYMWLLKNEHAAMQLQEWHPYISARQAFGAISPWHLRGRCGRLSLHPRKIKDFPLPTAPWSKIHPALRQKCLFTGWPWCTFSHLGGFAVIQVPKLDMSISSSDKVTAVLREWHCCHLTWDFVGCHYNVFLETQLFTLLNFFAQKQRKLISIIGTYPVQAVQQGKDETQTIPHSPPYKTSPALAGKIDLANSIIHIYIKLIILYSYLF